jgi:hypothetical protein
VDEVVVVVVVVVDGQREETDDWEYEQAGTGSGPKVK